MEGYVDLYRIKNGKCAIDKFSIGDIASFEKEIMTYDKFSKNFGEIVVAHGYVKGDEAKRDNCFGIMLPSRISETDYYIFTKLFSGLEKVYEKNKKNFGVNHRFTDLGDDFDYFTDYGYCSSSIMGIADFFSREKVGRLKQDEKSMLDDYLKFDLENILIGNFMGLPLCHGNAGVMIITEHNTLKTTVKTQNHAKEILKLMGMIYGSDKVPENNTNAAYCGMFNNVIVHIAKNMVLIWAPESLTEYQQKEIEELYKAVSEIKKKSIGEMMLFTCVVKYNQNSETWDSLEDLSLDSYFNKYVEAAKVENKLN